MAEIASGGGFDRDSAMKIRGAFERLLSDAKSAVNRSIVTVAGNHLACTAHLPVSKETVRVLRS